MVFKSTSVPLRQQKQFTCLCYHKTCCLPANACYDVYVWAELFTCERVGPSLSPVLQFDIGNRAFALLWALELLFFLRLGLQGFYTKLQLAGVLLVLHKETGGKQDVRNRLPTISTDVTVLRHIQYTEEHPPGTSAQCWLLLLIVNSGYYLQKA